KIAVLHTNEHDPTALRDGIGIEWPPRTAPRPYSEVRAEHQAEAGNEFRYCGAVDGTRVCAKGRGHTGPHQTETTPDGLAAQWDDPQTELDAARSPGQVAFDALMAGENVVCPWDGLNTDEQDDWESAAAAVIAHHLARQETTHG